MGSIAYWNTVYSSIKGVADIFKSEIFFGAPIMLISMYVIRVIFTLDIPKWLKYAYFNCVYLYFPLCQAPTSFGENGCEENDYKVHYRYT